MKDVVEGVVVKWGGEEGKWEARKEVAVGDVVGEDVVVEGVVEEEEAEKEEAEEEKEVKEEGGDGYGRRQCRSPPGSTWALMWNTNKLSKIRTEAVKVV